MAKSAETALGRDDLQAIADEGYFSGSDIFARHPAGITTTPRAPKLPATGAWACS